MNLLRDVIKYIIKETIKFSLTWTFYHAYLYQNFMIIVNWPKLRLPAEIPLIEPATNPS